MPFQHVKDFSKRYMYQNADDGSDSSDCQLGLKSCPQSMMVVSKCQELIQTPFVAISTIVQYMHRCRCVATDTIFLQVHKTVTK